jgi:electron transport complex protein RnfA
MAEYFAIIIGLVLVNQFVLARAPATMPFPLDIARLRATALQLLSITAVVTSAAVVASLLDRLLINAFDLDAWRITIFVLLVVGLAQLPEALLVRAGPAGESIMEPALPLVTINSVALGLTLLLTTDELSPASGLLYGVGTGLTFAAVSAMISSASERIEAAAVPTAWRGIGISLVTAGMLSLAFTGLSGIVRN